MDNYPVYCKTIFLHLKIIWRFLKILISILWTFCLQLHRAVTGQMSVQILSTSAGISFNEFGKFAKLAKNLNTRENFMFYNKSTNTMQIKNNNNNIC